MSKLKGPLLSLGATGALTKLFALLRRRGQHIIEQKPIPTDAKSPAQLFNRHMFTKCIDLWHLLSEAEKAEWESLATPRHMTGYAWFISQCLRPNPGIYLPLQGGTMSGDIDMDKNRLLKLPEPTHNQEAATKGYADTHGMQAHESTHVKDGSDEIDSALAIEAMAGLANTKIWQGNAAGRPVEVALPAGDAATKEFFVPVFGGTNVVYQGGNVNGAGRQAWMALLVPQDFTAITDLEVIFLPNAPGASMNFVIQTRYGAYNGGEIFTVHTETADPRDIGATVASTNLAHSIADLVDVAALVAGDFLGVVVSYDVAAIDSNAYVRGLRLKYT